MEGADVPVSYTYNVVWEEDKISWGTRWDHYLHVFDPQIHWFSIVNSIIIVLILASMVSMILLRALHKDISRYNALGDEDAAHDDFGWKMVHADVFRPPKFRMLLCVLLGTGAQLLCMITVTLMFAVLGFLSPSSRGSLGTMALVFYVFFSSTAGYVSSIMYKSYQGENRKQNVILTALLIPGIIFGIFIILNFILISKESSSAVPFGTMLALFAMWFLVSIPLCISGAYFGFRHHHRLHLWKQVVQLGIAPPISSIQQEILVQVESNS
jgi:transmembrane 9 superfamily protein 2/4